MGLLDILPGRRKKAAPAPEEEAAGEMLISCFDTAEIEAHVEALEKRIKAPLPGSYRRFLLRYNGGETPKTAFSIGEVSSDLRALYGLGNADPHYHFSKQRGAAYRYLRQGMLLIGENVWGDHVACQVSGEGAGSIWFLYHDRSPRKFLPLAGDFSEFVSLCRSRPLGHIRTVEERAALRKKMGPVTPEIVQMWQKEIEHLQKLHQEPLIL